MAVWAMNRVIDGRGGWKVVSSCSGRWSGVLLFWDWHALAEGLKAPSKLSLSSSSRPSAQHGQRGQHEP